MRPVHLAGLALSLLATSPAVLAGGSAPVISPGWPKLFTGSSVDGPLLMDLDGDAELERVQTVQGLVRAYDPDGGVVPGWPVSTGNGTFGAPAAGDIDGDGALEIVVCSWFFGISGEVWAFERDGSTVSGFPVVLGGPMKHAALGDVDGDGDAEIATVQNGGSEAYLYLLDGGGNTLPGWPRQLDTIAGSGPSLGDLDGDGDLEVLCPSFESVFAFEHDGAPLSGFPFTPGPNLTFNYTTLGLGDLDENGDLEIVAVTAEANGGNASKTYVLHHDGTVASGWPKITPDDFPFIAPTLVDLDEDGWLDVIVAGQLLSPTPVNSLYAWDRDGNPLPGFPYGPIDGVFSQVAAIDIDGDAHLELVFDSNVGSSGFQAVNHDGSVVTTPGWPLEPFAAPFSSTFQQMLNAADIDADGLMELVGSGNIIQNGETVLYTWDTDVPWRGEKTAPVGTYQYGASRAGVADPDLGLVTDVGFALAGTAGAPWLRGQGDLVSGEPVCIDLRGALPGGSTYLIVGASALLAPFKGGTLVPDVTLLLGPLPLTADGELFLTLPWPNLPSGVPLFWQHWIPDAGAPVGFAASNALATTTW